MAIMRQVVQEADRRCGSAPAVDAVFTSEPYGQELARQFGSAHVYLDQARSLYPSSGTAVQAGLALRVVVRRLPHGSRRAASTC